MHAGLGVDLHFIYQPLLPPRTAAGAAAGDGHGLAHSALLLLLLLLLGQRRQRCRHALMAASMGHCSLLCLLPQAALLLKSLMLLVKILHHSIHGLH